MAVTSLRSRRKQRRRLSSGIRAARGVCPYCARIVDLQRIRTALRVRCGYAVLCAGLGADAHVSAVRSTRRVHCVEYRQLEKFSGFLCFAGGSRGCLGPGVVCFLLFISTGLSALIYALINALKKLTHCVNALKKLTP